MDNNSERVCVIYSLDRFQMSWIRSLSSLLRFCLKGWNISLEQDGLGRGNSTYLDSASGCEPDLFWDCLLPFSIMQIQTEICKKF